jgi:hypothetical protein
VVDGEECWLISGKPTNPDAERQTGYSSIEIWVSKSKLVTVRMRAQLAEGHKTKYIRASEFKAAGSQWTAHRVEARTVQGDKLVSKTMLVTLKFANDDPSITDQDFTKSRLEQGM